MTPVGRVPSIHSILIPPPADLSIYPQAALEITRSLDLPHLDASELKPLEAVDSESTSETATPTRYTAQEIAQSLWLSPETLISEDMVQKVNEVSLYLHQRGLKLQGTKADGNCFCSAFLGSYQTLTRRKIPLLDTAKNPLSFLREQIAGVIEKTDIDRAQEIKEDRAWITALGEGDLLAKVLKIPIRVVTVNKDTVGCGISDILTFIEPDKPQQEWETIDEREKPAEYVLIIDLEGHFIFAKPFRHKDPRKISPQPPPRNNNEVQEHPIPKTEGSEASGGIKRKRPGSFIKNESPVKRAREPFENQVYQDNDRLSELQKEWQSYRNKFAVAHLKIENAQSFAEIDWSEFKSKLRENFSRRLECCRTYNKDQIKVADNVAACLKLKLLVHERYVLEGALNLLDGNIEQAIKLFREAILFEPTFLPVWLFLASSLYRLERYAEVIDLVEHYRRKHNGDSLIRFRPFLSIPYDHIFSLYSHFSLLTDECIEQNFLQLTHPIYVNTEMHFYLAKAKLALNPSDKEGLANVFYRRGIECMNGGWLQQAVINFEKSRELCPDISLDEHYSQALFATGRIREAIEEIKSTIEQATDNEQKAKYLNRLIEYYVRCDQISDADAYLDQIPHNQLSNLMLLYLAYFRAKIKLSLPNPALLAFQRLTEQFFNYYQQLDPLQQEKRATLWLSRFLELRDEFCNHYKTQGKIAVIIQVHQLFIGIFEELVKTLEKAFIPHGKWEENAHFPNWVYDRLYLGYFELLIKQYWDFINYHHAILREVELSSEDNQLSSQLLSRYKTVEAEIKAKLKLFELRRGWPNQDRSGISEAYDRLMDYVKLIEGSSSHDESESIELEEVIQNYQELLKSTPDKTEIQDIYSNSLKEAQILCASIEDSFFQIHCELILCRLNFAAWPVLIQLLAHRDTTIESKLVNNFEAICKIIDRWLIILRIYHGIIEEETLDVLKNTHSKSLIKYQLAVFPHIAKILLMYFNRLKEASCNTSALRAVEYIKDLLTPLRALKIHQELSRSQSQQLDNLFKALDEALAQVGSISSQRSITELSQQLLIHPLDLKYGKRDLNYRIPFPSRQIIDSLRQLKQTEGVTWNKNLSAHCFTIVYSSRAADGTKNPRRTLHLPLNPARNFFTADYLPSAAKSYVERTQRRYQIYKEAPDKDKEELKLSFKESEVKLDFSAYHHLHSEQAFFEWLNRELLPNLINNLEREGKDFKPGCKIHMIAFDMGSSYDSCINCRLAALSMQSGKQENGDFLIKLEKILLDGGYRLPRERDGLRLKAVTRILAETIRNTASLHTNPDEKNVKYLKNLGIFQHVISNVFASGSSRNVKSHGFPGKPKT